MLIHALDHLRMAGLKVEEVVGRNHDPNHLVLEIELDGIRRSFQVELKARTPFSNEVHALVRKHRSPSSGHQPLLIAPSIPESLGRKLSQAGWSWADQEGNFHLRAPRFLARQRLTAGRPKQVSKPWRLPQGGGALGIIRFLVRSDGPIGPTELANIAGVSQPRATQVLKQLREGDLVEGGGGNWVANRRALIETFLLQYRGPGGTEEFFYSLDSPLETARRLIDFGGRENIELAASADVGPDLIEPWRRPTDLVLYAKRHPLSEFPGLVRAQSKADSNVRLRVPDDESVFPRIESMEVEGLPCVDVTQMIWDLVEMGGSDRLEASNRLQEWLLNR